MYGKMDGNVKPYSTDVCVPIDSLDEMISRAQEILRKWAMTSLLRHCDVTLNLSASKLEFQDLKFEDLGILLYRLPMHGLNADLQNVDGYIYI